MTSITIYDGATTIGGSKIFVEENGNGVFLDFGKNFKKYGMFYQEYLSDRSSRGIHDLLLLNLIPKIQNYRADLIPSDLDISSFPKLNIDAVLLSHAHQDHFGNIGLLDPNIPIVASPITLVLLKGILDTTRSDIHLEVAYYSEKSAIDDMERILRAKRQNYTCRNFHATLKCSNELHEFMRQQAKKTKCI